MVSFANAHFPKHKPYLVIGVGESAVIILAHEFKPLEAAIIQPSYFYQQMAAVRLTVLR